ncbi:hypothetical protein F9288_09050 [Sphingomonas sp. CL5.1]|uniref:hypothetical protein n=1 Tax=Sphingomonas sp. CL5.1 TaxID=2653203 RepID=UPI0015824C5C|nr:hypothetical protein [Sphingomonas sp. CL5.1]QKR99766.1 hypothetical protein F9288_09050 [Sphingomonas sp. CL5.1]
MKRVGLIIGAALLLSGCTGPVRTRFGGQPATTARDPVSAVAVEADSQADRHWPAIHAAITEQGLNLDPASPYRLAFAFGSRPAGSAILASGGAVVSPARKRHLFQSCPGRTYRLVVTLTDTRTGDLIGRGWADEAHCRAAADEALPALAARAVAMLAHPVPQGSDLRWTRN